MPLYAGYYELRAYTRWMLNFGQCEYPHVRISEDLFYSKKMAKEFFRDYEKLYSRVFPVYPVQRQYEDHDRIDRVICADQHCDLYLHGDGTDGCGIA